MVALALCCCSTWRLCSLCSRSSTVAPPALHPRSTECTSLSSRGLLRREQEVAWAKAAAAEQPPLPLHIFRLGGRAMNKAEGVQACA